MPESNQTKAESEVTDGKIELERVMSTMENLEIGFPDVKGTVSETRLLPQANLPSASSKGKHLIQFNPMCDCAILIPENRSHREN